MAIVIQKTDLLMLMDYIIATVFIVLLLIGILLLLQQNKATQQSFQAFATRHNLQYNGNNNILIFPSVSGNLAGRDFYMSLENKGITSSGLSRTAQPLYQVCTWFCHNPNNITLELHRKTPMNALQFVFKTQNAPTNIAEFNSLFTVLSSNQLFVQNVFTANLCASFIQGAPCVDGAFYLKNNHLTYKAQVPGPRFFNKSPNVHDLTLILALAENLAQRIEECSPT